MNENLTVKIRQWKEVYGSIFRTKIKGQEYIYRTLNTRECEKILECFKENKAIEAEDISLNAILYPENFNPEEYSIEVSRYLSKCIVDSSHISDSNGISILIEKAKKDIEYKFQFDLFQWKMTLMSIFPGYTLSELDKMSIQEFFNLIVFAEKVTGKELINYGDLSRSIDNEKLKNVDTKNVTTESKFLSKNELESISIDQATKNLREHWLKNRK